MTLAAACTAAADAVTWPEVGLTAVIVAGIIAFFWVMLRHA